MLPTPWATVPYMVVMTIKNILAFVSPDQPLQKAILCGMAISLSTIIAGILIIWPSKQDNWIRFLLIAFAIAEIIVSALTLADVPSVEVKKACALTFIGCDGLVVASALLYWMIGRQVRLFEISHYQYKNI